MSTHENDRVAGALVALIEESLAWWGWPGTVRQECSDSIIVETAGRQFRIARAGPGLPFRWSIVVDGRRRVAGSATGLLRALRTGLDPDFRPSRIRIAPLDVVSP